MKPSRWHGWKTVHVPEDLHRALDDKAHVERTTIRALIDRLLRAALKAARGKA
jgi:hypothetical protein